MQKIDLLAKSEQGPVTGRTSQRLPLTPGGEYLLCAGTRRIDGATTYSVKAWDLRAKRWAFELPDTELQYYQLSPNGRYLLGTRVQKRAEPRRWVIWDLQGPRVAAEGTLVDGVACTFSADSKTAAIVAELQDGRGEVWDLLAGQRLYAFLAGGDLAWDVMHASISANDRYYCTVAYWGSATQSLGRMRILETTTGHVLWQREYHSLGRWPTRHLPVFSPDGETLVIAVDPAKQHGRAGFLEGDASGSPLQVAFVHSETGTEQSHVPIGVGVDLGAFWRFPVLSSVGPAYLVHEHSYFGPPVSPWLEKLRGWVPGFPKPKDSWCDLLSVVEIEGRREVFRLPEGYEVDAWLSSDGRSLLTREKRSDGTDLPDAPELTCWDVPGRKPLRWVFGPVLALAGVAIGGRFAWIRAARKRKVVCTAETPKHLP